MKTPMEKLIEHINQNENEYISKEHTIRAIEVIFIPEERQVIIDSWKDGRPYWENVEDAEAKQYFNQKFGSDGKEKSQTT